MVDEGPAVFGAVMGVDRKTGPLIHQQDMLIFVDDIQLGSGNGQKSIILPRFIKKLIVDIELKHIPRLKPGVPLRSGAVEFDALDADIFLGQRCGQKRDRLT